MVYDNELLTVEEWLKSTKKKLNKIISYRENYGKHLTGPFK